MTHEKRARELAFLCFCASASRLCQNEERRASERGMHDNDNPTRAKQERGHVHMMSAQGGGGFSKSRCCKEADAGKKLCKGGCVKMKTREGGDKKIRKCCRRHMYMAPKVIVRPSLIHSAYLSRQIIAPPLAQDKSGLTSGRKTRQKTPKLQSRAAARFEGFVECVKRVHPILQLLCSPRKLLSDC